MANKKPAILKTSHCLRNEDCEKMIALFDKEISNFENIYKHTKTKGDYEYFSLLRGFSDVSLYIYIHTFII